MKILKVLIKNYRIHKDIEIDLSENITLIGGANETGKSTIVEAIHKGLFLKSNGNSAAHREIKSLIHQGAAEVILTIEHQKKVYTLKKRFGSNGETTLSGAHMQTMHGSEADDFLSSMLNAESGTSGNQYKTQWANLWVWQGTSGNDPLVHVGEQKTNLLQGLQSLGATAVIQSEYDAYIAKVFQQKNSENYTSTNKIKSGSKLDIAQSLYKENQQKLQEQKEKVEKIQQAADKLISTKKEIAECNKTLSQAASKIQILRQKTVEIQDKNMQLQVLENEYNQHVEKLKTLEEADSEIQKNDALIERLTQSLTPKNEQINELEKHIYALQTQKENTTNEQTNLQEKLQLISDNIKYLNALKLETQLKNQLAILLKKETQINEIIAKIEELNKQYNSIPNILKDDLQSLEKTAQSIRETKATLNAISTQIELINSTEKVFLNSTELKPNQSQLISQNTLINIGNNTQISIKPGGGNTVIQATLELQKLETQLKLLYKKTAVQSVDEAKLNFVKRTEIQQKIATENHLINNLNPTKTKEEIVQLNHELQALSTQITKQKPTTKNMGLANLSDLPKLEMEFERDVPVYKNNQTKIQQIAQQLEAATEKLTTFRNEIEEESRLLEDRKSIQNYWLATRGQKTERQKEIETQKALTEQAAKQMAVLKAKRDEMNPDQTTRDLAQFEQVRQKQQEQLTLLSNLEGQLEGQVAQDGSTNPMADLDAIYNAFRIAEQNVQKETQNAEAIALLHQTFTQEQQMLSDMFTVPLSEKIKQYLTILFGANTAVILGEENGHVSGLQIYRDSHSEAGSLSFAELSGGTKEQVATAVKLAMAEVIATQFDGCLPIVFDDSFTNTDPDRLQSLQQMLYLAANNGLQIIVLSCNPKEYAMLGAQLYRLG
jgi:DNA repair exonuclease SbcCD ATPase subunit